MCDNQIDNIEGLIEKFRSAASGKSDATRLNYLKAINCLDTFLGSYSYAQEFPSLQTLADWLLNMRMRGLSSKTALHYIDIISAICKGTATHDGTDVFSQFRQKAVQVLNQKTEWPIDDAAFGKIRKLSAASLASNGTMRLAADMMTYALLSDGMPLFQVATLKKTDIAAPTDPLSEIIKRNSAPNRKYIFALNQSECTPKQLSRKTEWLISDLFAANGIAKNQSADDAIKLIRAYAAMKCGIPGSELLSLLETAPSGIPELALCLKADISDRQRSTLLQTIHTQFSGDPRRWYAMKLRGRVAFQDLEQRIRTLDKHLPRPEFFYPYEEIRRRVGKKMVKNSKPVIRDIVFFKLRLTDIFPLFCRIGDLAWVYTTTGRPGSDYAPIPKKSFERFQDTIGQFTPEYDIAPIGGFRPKEGEKVVVINGPLASYNFEVDKVTDADNVIFQLNMIGDNGFQWRTSARQRQLEPAKSIR
ncbi:MAG: hypothetical protein NC453_12525 [Muribaculum sp.]|nr:hypothetical protein [Muribaculum sp.]